MNIPETPYQLEIELAARIKQQEAVAHLGQLALSGIDLPELMDETVSLVAQTLDVEYCMILELQDEQRSLLLKAGVGWKDIRTGRPQTPVQKDSLANYTLATHQPVIVADLDKETRFKDRDLLLEHHVVSGMSTVIGSIEQPYGVLEAHSRRKRSFSQDDVHFMQSIANILGTALKRKQAEDDLKALNADLEKRVAERTEYVRLLSDVAMASNEALTIQDALQFSLARVCSQLSWPVGHVFLAENETQVRLVPSSIWYLADAERYADFKGASAQLVFTPDDCLLGIVYTSRQAQWTADLHQIGKVRGEFAEAAGLRACCVVPILSGSEVAAVLEFFSVEETQPDENLLNVLTQLGTQLGRVIERIRSGEELRKDESLLAQAQALAHLGSWEWELSTDRVTWSDEMYRIYGLEPKAFPESYHGFLDRVHPEDREAINQKVKQAIERIEPFEYYHRIVLPTGEIRYIYAQGTVVADETGKAVYMFGTGQDITERQLIETALQDRQEMFESLFEYAPDGLLLVDSGGKILRLNRQAETLFGYARVEMVGIPVDSLISGGFAKWNQRQHANARGITNLRLADPSLDVEGIRKDGSHFTADLTLNPIQRGEETQWICTVRDVSEWRRAERKLAASERMLRMVLTAAPLIIWSANQERVITLMEGKGLASLGLSAGQLVGMPVDKFLKDYPDILGHVSRAYTGDYVVAQIETPQGGVYETRYAPLLDEHQEIVGITGVAFDITQRVKAESALRASEERYRRVIESVKNYAIFTLDPNGLVTSWNIGGETILGYRSSEIIGKHFSIFYSPDAIENGVPEEALKRAVAEGKCQLEDWHVRKDGEQIWVNIFISPMYSTTGELIGFSKVDRDMTERKRMEEELRESESRFRTIFMGAGIGISLADLERGIAIYNPALQNMLGYSHSELRRLHLLELTHPLDLPASEKLYNELVSGERDIYMLEKRFLRKDGTLLWVNLTVSLVRDVEEHPRFTISMVEDISARKQMQAELEEVKTRLMDSREEERLQLAQDLHDDPIQELHGILYQLSALSLDGQNEDEVKTIESVNGTVSQVIDTLRTICGELRPPSLSPFGLEGAIRDHAEHFHKLHPEIELNLDMVNDKQILPDRMRLSLFRIYQQAMANIIRHAQASRVDVRFQWDAEQVSLEIQDNGVGFEMPRHWIDLARQGHLGLVGAAERIEVIHGELEIISKPGEGTLIRATAPREPEPPKSI